MVPTGWHDDGTTLTAPNGVAVRLGFRDFVLGNTWHPDNWPLGPEQGVQLLEASNPSLGGGTQQVFRYSMLGYTEARGVFLEWLGVELNYARGQAATYYAEYKQAQADIATLQQQLRVIGQPTGIAEATVKDRLTAIGLAASNGNAAIQQLVNQPL